MDIDLLEWSHNCFFYTFVKTQIKFKNVKLNVLSITKIRTFESITCKQCTYMTLLVWNKFCRFPKKGVVCRYCVKKHNWPAKINHGLKSTLTIYSKSYWELGVARHIPPVVPLPCDACPDIGQVSIMFKGMVRFANPYLYLDCLHVFLWY